MNINGIDKTDNRIIDLLLEDGRMSYSEIADRVGLSRTAVKNRIDALEKSGCRLQKTCQTRLQQPAAFAFGKVSFPWQIRPFTGFSHRPILSFSLQSEKRLFIIKVLHFLIVLK